MHRAAGLAIVILVLTSVAADAQDAAEAPAPQNQWFIRAGYSPGRVLTASELVSGENRVRALTFEIGRQTDGTRDWHRVYNYPSYGVGIDMPQFDQRAELGRPLSAYGFFSWPFPLSRRVHVTADFGLGVSWRWKEFDRETNVTNTSIGSDMAYHVDGGVFLRHVTTSRVSVYGGLDFSHWSNGGSSRPNLGLATVGPKVGVRYNMAPQMVRGRVPRAELPRFEPAWEFVAGAAGGRKRRAGAFNVTSGVQRQFYRFGKVATGADFTRDGATSVGMYGGYEHVIARFSVLVQLGYGVWRDADVDMISGERIPRLYQRYGSRFHVTDHIWGGFAVRAIKGRKANFIELGGGYRLIIGPR